MSTNYVIGEKIFSYCELFINPAQLILGGKSFFGIKKHPTTAYLTGICH